MENLYWVGSRKSDIIDTGDLFRDCIALYGDSRYCLTEQAKIRIDNNTGSAERDAFILSNIESIVRSDPSARFCFYDPSWAYEIRGLEAYRNRFVCLNRADLYEKFNNKIAFYEMVRGIVPTFYRGVFKGAECSYGELCERFRCKRGSFIVQEPISNGGHGTYRLNGRNKLRIAAKLDPQGRYLVSEYYADSVPVNMHMIVTDCGPVLLPGSVQILRPEHDRLIYRGADYDTYRRIGQPLREEFAEYVRKIGETVCREGYRGVCGVDGLIVNGKVYFVEFNPRFQGSTAVLNRALSEQGRPSVQKLNLAAFRGETIPGDVDIPVPYSTYSYVSACGRVFGNHILKNANGEERIAQIDRDGYTATERMAKGLYMFRVTLHGNITSINEDGGLFYHEHIVEPNERLYRKVLKLDRLAVKISLMSLGVKLTERARTYLLNNGGIRPGNNNAVDMDVLNMVVNAPCDISYIALTPFTIDLSADNELLLSYYGKYLTEVKLYPLDPLGAKKTSRGVPYDTVAYLSTDRLRVHMTNECIYKRKNIGCKFCNIVPCADPISLEDVREVVNDYVAHSPAVKHFLIGGQSMDQKSGMEAITQIAHIIRRATKEKRIYVMALPYDEASIKSLVDAGIDELACNIEIFDKDLALKYMPGKGAIPRTTYYRVLSYAHTLLPEPGSVRAMLIYGLEPRKSFIKGIAKLVELGIQPIISVFRPLPNTPLEHLMAPPLMSVYDLYLKAEALCEKFGLRLGPACVFCQNNTLSLPESNAPLPDLAK